MITVDHLQTFALFLPSFAYSPVLLSGGGTWWVPIVAKAFNLTLFLGAMYFFVRKPAREFFATRLAEVRATLERAAQEKAVAESKMSELNARLSKLDSEIAAIRTQAASEAEAEGQRLAAEAKADAAKLSAQATREIEGAKQAALLELREFTAEKAVDLAEQMIRQELTPQIDAKLLQRMGEQLTKVS